MDEYEDHRLTLLAGKAAGLRLQWSDNCGDWSTGEPYGKDDKRWRPLHNNDDAFRLMVDLCISVNPRADVVWATTSDEARGFIETPDESSVMEATRLVIVRTAASLSTAGLSDAEAQQIEYLMSIYR